MNIQELKKQQAYSEYTFNAEYLKPKFWSLWLLLGTLWLIGRLPLPFIAWLAKGIGTLMYKMGGSRLKITRRNIELCFPERAKQEQEELVKRNFQRIAMALFEPGIAWWSSSARIQRLGRIKGLEHVQPLIENKAPILMISMHNFSVEMAARFVGEAFPFNILYRAHDNPVYEYTSISQRNKHQGKWFPRKYVKPFLNTVANGEVGLFLPDQDLGLKRSIFVPFFNIQAATIPNVSDYAHSTKAKVIYLNHYLSDDGKYTVKIFPPLKNFPSNDRIADTARINKIIEEQIQQRPDLYLWQHRRFKHRPEGEPKIY